MRDIHEGLQDPTCLLNQLTLARISRSDIVCWYKMYARQRYLLAGGWQLSVTLSAVSVSIISLHCFGFGQLSSGGDAIGWVITSG